MENALRGVGGILVLVTGRALVLVLLFWVTRPVPSPLWASVSSVK